MVNLSGQQLLELWERGANRHALDRALLLLAEMRPGESLQQLAEVSIGERDLALLDLHCMNFGRHLSAYIDCPACGTRLEFSLDSETLCKQPLPARLEVDGIQLRLPTSYDLKLALQQPDQEAAIRCLASRCTVSKRDGPAPELTPDEIARLETVLAEADSAADILLDCVCAQCEHTWQSAFDIADFLWSEIDTQAVQALDEIHLLACAYGWSEHDVLSLSDARREAYIDRVTA